MLLSSVSLMLTLLSSSSDLMSLRCDSCCPYNDALAAVAFHSSTSDSTTLAPRLRWVSRVCIAPESAQADEACLWELCSAHGTSYTAAAAKHSLPERSSERSIPHPTGEHHDGLGFSVIAGRPV
eukprot:scaffold689_cov375-Prasinococcus_capsulatus_cf.AAC.10